jgi:hypothetical protein
MSISATTWEAGIFQETRTMRGGAMIWTEDSQAMERVRGRYTTTGKLLRGNANARSGLGDSLAKSSDREKRNG